MSKTVFILGAGASKQAGAPVMREFLEIAKGLLERGEAGSKKQDFERVFDGIRALQDVHSKSQLDLENIETVFATFEMAGILKKFPRFQNEDIQPMIDSLVLLISTTIEATLNFPVHNGRPGVPEPYKDFVELIVHLRDEAFPRQSVSVITFNYDLACDLGFHYWGIPIDYALNSEATQSSGISLLKLHGSLNWAFCPGIDAVVPWTLQEFFRNRMFLPSHDKTRYMRFPITESLKEFNWRGEHVEPKPVLVPPTWNKSAHHRNLTNVWSRAAKELGEAENVFFIGYSLPPSDAFFRYLFALATAGGDLFKRIWVFDPEPLVEENYQKILGNGAKPRFKYHKLNFQSAIGIIKKEFPARS